MPAAPAAPGSRSSGTTSSDVEKEHPAEDSERERGDEAGSWRGRCPSPACRRSSTSHSTKFWKLARHTGAGTARRRVEQPAEHHGEQHREEHAVEIDDGKVEDAVAASCSSETSGGGRCTRSSSELLLIISRQNISLPSTVLPSRPSPAASWPVLSSTLEKVATYVTSIATAEVFINVSTSTNSTMITANFAASPTTDPRAARTPPACSGVAKRQPPPSPDCRLC